MRIYHDSFQEGMWFRELHPALAEAELRDFPRRPSHELLAKALLYDRPDIVLTDGDDNPLFVLERTIEVPSGHNVGQRFARLAAAAEAGVPAVYFGPYSAFKHGGITAGPRYMNLRLFYAIDRMMELTSTPVTTIRWPVDDDFEIVHQPWKDNRLRIYLEMLFESLPSGLEETLFAILHSEFEREQDEERQQFIAAEVARPDEYSGPPTSVTIGASSRLPELRGCDLSQFRHEEVVLYRVGMTYMRSDPYTGMGLLYAYLYCGGTTRNERDFVFHFTNLSREAWRDAATRSPNSKMIRLYRLIADAIVFEDGCFVRSEL